MVTVVELLPAARLELERQRSGVRLGRPKLFEDVLIAQGLDCRRNVGHRSVEVFVIHARLWEPAMAPLRGSPAGSAPTPSSSPRSSRFFNRFSMSLATSWLSPTPNFDLSIDSMAGMSFAPSQTFQISTAVLFR